MMQCSTAVRFLRAVLNEDELTGMPKLLLIHPRPRRLPTRGTQTGHRGQHMPGRDPDFWFEDGNRRRRRRRRRWHLLSHPPRRPRHYSLFRCPRRIPIAWDQAVYGHRDVNTTDGCVVSGHPRRRQLQGIRVLRLLYAGTRKRCVPPQLSLGLGTGPSAFCRSPFCADLHRSR